jgi:glutamyl-tRNA synthetase
MISVRFAPSPTGYLHVGNIRPALANHLFARRSGGRFLLRLDDTDRERGRPEYAEAIEQDLRWLGISWDEMIRQSDRLALYSAAAERLKATGRLYPCFESSEELKAKREAALRRGRAPVYDRAMLRMTHEQREAAEAGGKVPYWRFLLSDGAVGWNDLVQGPRQVKLPSVSDPVVIRADGTPLYTFTSVVDDIETGITHIVRGEDHITNTGVQLDIFAALGADVSRLSFAHLSLLTDAEGGKLSKRLESLSLRSLRNDGVEASAVAAYLARLGTSDDPAPLPMEALAAGFDFSHFSHSAARFDIGQLLALNRKVLHGLPFAAVADRLPQGATETFWLAVRGNLDLLTEARYWWAVVAGSIVPPVQDEADWDYLRAALHLLPAEPWGAETWPAWTAVLKDATNRKGKALFLPLRLALTGEDHGPELRDLLPLMGRERVARRLAVSAET